ncbi:MAG: CapA family protein [Clostridia bacterium]|nr:CapA family protein [Clostridia bacterium]
MGKKVAKQGKQGKKARREAARRRRQVRTVGIYLAVAALCVLCLAVLAHLGRTPEKPDTWYIQNGSLEIAAPGADRSGLDTLEGSASDADGEDLSILMPEVTEAPTPEPTPTPSPTPTATPLPTPEPTPVSITITAAGDCTLGGSVNTDTYERFKKVVRSQGYEYFFRNVRPIFEADDLTILNLEGPITDTGKGRHGTYCFKGDPDYVQIMTSSSVELCNVANNHSLDFGKAGLVRTAELLEQSGIGCCGYTKVFRTTVKGVRISALGFDKWQNDTAGIVQAIQGERPNCDLLIVNMHWGRERVYEPMAQQKEWGHAAINAGADLVIGTHPHVYGGVELYKGKYIAYSLGNFCFGGNRNPDDKRCLMFQQTFVVAPDGQVSDGGINVIPCLVTGLPNKNNYQPVVMTADAGKSLLKAVAKYSNLNRNTNWMLNSYPEQIGLLPNRIGVAGVRAVDLFTTVQTAAELTPTPEPVTITPEIEGIDDDALVGALDPTEDEFEDGNYVTRADEDYDESSDAFGSLDDSLYDDEESDTL